MYYFVKIFTSSQAKLCNLHVVRNFSMGSHPWPQKYLSLNFLILVKIFKSIVFIPIKFIKEVHLHGNGIMASWCISEHSNKYFLVLWRIAIVCLRNCHNISSRGKNRPRGVKTIPVLSYFTKFEGILLTRFCCVNYSCFYLIYSIVIEGD